MRSPCAASAEKRPRLPGLLAACVCIAALLLLPSGASPPEAEAGQLPKERGSQVRPPAVAGRFYPSDPRMLARAIDAFMKEAPRLGLDKPVALIAPHAGYAYSGQICADAYRQAAGWNYDIIIVLGVNHTSAGFRGISLSDYDAFRTPLGEVQVDAAIRAALLQDNKECGTDGTAHTREHSIEIQLPFIQTLFPKARIVPAIIHPPDYDLCLRFGRSLAKVLKNRNALIVISTDLSHYPVREDAAPIDRQTLQAAAAMDPQRFASLMRAIDRPGLETRACGEAAILAGMTAAQALGARRGTIAGYANSGDSIQGEEDRTVGYGGVVYTGVIDDGVAYGRVGNDPAAPAITSAPDPFRDSIRPPVRTNRLGNPEKRALLAFARETLKRYLTTQTTPLPRDFSDAASVPRGAFVTLKKEGELRGCIGNLQSKRALVRTVGAMALEAAFRDPRFPPVRPEELDALDIEISALTPLRSVRSPDEIAVGRDGVEMTRGGRSAVFLPQVAVENNWNRKELLDSLCQKGGWEAGCWRSNARFRIFQAEVFSESGFDHRRSE